MDYFEFVPFQLIQQETPKGITSAAFGKPVFSTQLAEGVLNKCQTCITILTPNFSHPQFQTNTEPAPTQHGGEAPAPNTAVCGL